MLWYQHLCSPYFAQPFHPVMITMVVILLTPVWLTVSKYTNSLTRVKQHKQTAWCLWCSTHNFNTVLFFMLAKYKHTFLGVHTLMTWKTKHSTTTVISKSWLLSTHLTTSSELCVLPLAVDLNKNHQKSCCCFPLSSSSLSSPSSSIVA